MRTVANILEHKPPMFNQISPKAKVIEALQLMNSVNLSYLIVMDGETFHGIFSERDYSRNVILKGLHSDSTSCGAGNEYITPYSKPANHSRRLYAFAQQP